MEIVRTGRKVHVERSRLERALWAALVGRRVKVVDDDELAADSHMTIDATGRRARSSQGIEEPPTPWTARTFAIIGRYSPSNQAIRIAALSDGYVYRCATGTELSIGFVGPASTDLEDPFSSLERMGLSWFLSGLPRYPEIAPGKGGKVSVQWSTGNSPFVRIGDAAMAVDALAAQGLVKAASDAMRIADKGALPFDGRPDRLQAHLKNLLIVIDSNRFREAPAWTSYREFLEQSLRHESSHGGQSE
jgi:flavin-dependent dehydrogenase